VSHSGKDFEQPARVPVDTLVTHALVVTMNADRHVIQDGAIAIKDTRIAAVGKSDAVEGGVIASKVIDGRRFVVTPGLVNSHIHVTGEPLTRGFVPDNIPFDEAVWKWVSPLHFFYTEDDERISAQLAALEMLRTGTTCFLEGGTINHLDAVVDGLQEIGIRGRVGQRVSDLSNKPGNPAESTDAAIKILLDEMDRYPEVADVRIAAWPILIGHTICSDELWRFAKKLSVDRNSGFSFHMSPVAYDPEWFLANYKRRPLEHLADLGILGDNVVITHLVHVNDAEVRLLAQTRTSVAHCPTTAMKVAYGVTQIGLFPEMADLGINVAIGTDGNNASNYSDLMRATYLVAGLFKDARRSPKIFPAEQAFGMATLNGARALNLQNEIGSLEPGKKADLVLHDTDRPEWRPLLNVANQLVWSADGRGVHSVFVDGVQVIDNYRCTTINEEQLYRRVQNAAREITERSGLPHISQWSII
jgi:5-methylthioadenosine/S-adenosylhomocysteine deaminase